MTFNHTLRRCCAVLLACSIPFGQSVADERNTGKALDEASVVLIPGIGFGEPGEGYVRAALTVNVDRLAEAVERLGAVDW